MESKIQRYQEHARDCVRMAARADTTQARAHFLDLARTWIETALAEREIESRRLTLPSAGWSSGVL
jgi:hypothetical protein